MKPGNFQEYTWEDIRQLIFKDIGLGEKKDQKEFGQLWNIGAFNPPDEGVCVEVKYYTQTYDERLWPDGKPAES